MKGKTWGGLAAMALLTLPAQATSITFWHSDASFELGAQFDKLFSGNVQIGNNALKGTWEYSIMNAAEKEAFDPQQFVFSAPDSYQFSITQDGPRYHASLKLNSSASSDKTFTFDPGTKNNALAIRARASAETTSHLASPTIDFHAPGVSDIHPDDLVGDNNAEYVMIASNGFAGGFTIAGDFHFMNRKSNAVPSFQFKFGHTDLPIGGDFTTAVPEPGTFVLGFAVCAVLGCAARSRARVAGREVHERETGQADSSAR